MKPSMVRGFRAKTALWGKRYQLKAAEQLGIGARSVQRYDNGERDVLPVLTDRLRKMLKARRAEIPELLKGGA